MLVVCMPPLLRNIEVTGTVTVRLWIASDAPDTDFAAKLIDLHTPNDDYPQGFAMNLTEGILGARYRDSWEEPSLLAPGEVYPSRSSCSRPATYSCAVIGCGSTSRAATSRILTSIRIRGTLRARWSIRALPAIACSSMRTARHTSCCRSFPRLRRAITAARFRRDLRLTR